jgi:hypothetical protein
VAVATEEGSETLSEGVSVSPNVVVGYPGAHPLPVRRHPVLRLAVVVAAGMLVGAVIGWKLPAR